MRAACRTLALVATLAVGVLAARGPRGLNIKLVESDRRPLAPAAAPDGASFTAVSCTVASACTAVGCRMTARLSSPCTTVTRGVAALAERWSGSG